MFRVGVFQTVTLCSSRGSDPEVQLTETARDALSGVVDATVDMTYARQSPPTENPSCASQTLQWWAERVEGMPRDEIDAAILLTDAPYGAGGCTALPDRRAIVIPGRPIEMPTSKAGSSVSHAALWVGLHEIGHALGGVHDMSPDPGKQSPGEAWIDDRGYHLTPMVADDGVMNACGEEIPQRPDVPAVFELEYGKCFRSILSRQA